ncbi:MAG: trimethylamine methyltransferase family protein [Actinomycetota bacterium]|nr:trimethylamine methyltransferase family protein [Actinomycetota bacterium]
MIDTTVGRQGVLVDPVRRLDEGQVQAVHEASLRILGDIGILCYNREASALYGGAGCLLSEEPDGSSRVKFPPDLVEDCLANAPSRVVLGAREPDNMLVLEAEEPRVRFGSGSEANIYLDMHMEEFRRVGGEEAIRHPVYERRRGSVELLCQAARLCQQLENLDFFIRTVNIQDTDIAEEDKDANKFFASLNNIDKHVMAGLTALESLDKVIRMGEIIAGGEEELRSNPVLSFITCVAKSPLQFVDDTAQKMMEIVKRGLPVVVSSSPQGGSTAPITEAGMVSQINAEIIAGITLSQLVRAGAPVLYGSVPVRARMDDLNDLYGAPEFCQYNMDCVQMARFYHLPCYSTAGVGDAVVPGVQATVEKLLSHVSIPMSGAQYVHYAFGLLEKTNVFSPDQAVLDDALIGAVKHMLVKSQIDRRTLDEAYSQIERVMDTPHKLYARYARKGIRSGEIFPPYFFETREDVDIAVLNAHERRLELLEREPHYLGEDVVNTIYDEVPGLVGRINPYS